MSAASPDDLKRHLTGPMTIADLLESEDSNLPKGKGNLNLTAGVSNNGFEFEMLRKNIFKNGDFTKFAFHLNHLQWKTYSCSYMHPFVVPKWSVPSMIQSEANQLKGVPVGLSYTFEIDTKSSKFESREHSHILELQSEDSPWTLKLERTIRKNLIDQDASRHFLLYESLPSVKYSSTLSFLKMTQNYITKFSTELAVPLVDDRSPSFFKFEAKNQRKWEIIADKLNFVVDLQAGLLTSPLKQHVTFVNDRFFLHNTCGYLAIGHDAPPNSLPALQTGVTGSHKLIEKEAVSQLTSGLAEVRIGDDLGVEKYMYLGARLDFINIPYLRDFNCRLYSAAEAIWYPKLTQKDLNLSQSFKSQTRFSLGFGMNMPLNEFISIALYYNAANFGSKQGDIERQSLINVTFCYF